jgi:hypothetical protein
MVLVHAMGGDLGAFVRPAPTVLLRVGVCVEDYAFQFPSGFYVGTGAVEVSAAVLLERLVLINWD